MTTPRLTLYQRFAGTYPQIAAAFDEVSRALAGIMTILADVHKGTWVAGRRYVVGQLVNGSDGSTYVAIADSTSKDPTTTDGSWQIFASAGTSGASTVGRRQTVLSGAVAAATGLANFMSAGSGLTVDLAATTTPVAIAFAAGHGSSGPVDYVGYVSADDASCWSGLTASTTNYLYVDRNSSTGALTYGQSLYWPMYQAFAPSYHARPASKDGTPFKVYGDANGAVTLAFNEDEGTNYGSTNTFGAAVGAADVGYDFGAGVTKQVLAFTIRNYGTAGNNTSSVKVEWSSDGAAWTTIQTSALSTTASAVQTITVAAYTAARYFRLLCNAGPAAGIWYVPEVQFWWLPSDTHWFDTAAMTMKSYNGTTWDTKQRVFMGEAVTDATSVTSCTTYALNGDYDSGYFYVDTSATQYTKTHNLGVSLDEGVDSSVSWSRVGSSHDNIPIEGHSYAGVTRSGYTWNQPNPGTTYQYNRLTAYLLVDNIPAYRSTSETRGYYRLRLRRIWG
jgi:hypothetical protein